MVVLKSRVFQCLAFLFLLVGAFLPPIASAQSLSCDDPLDGSGACLRWGFHRLFGIGEVYDLSRDGSTLITARNQGTIGASIHRYQLGSDQQSVSPAEVAGEFLGIQAGHSVVSSNGRYVAVSAEVTSITGSPKRRLFRWDADTDVLYRLPDGPTSNFPKFGWSNGYVAPSGLASISADGSTIAGLGLGFNDQGIYFLNLYNFVWTESSGTSDTLQAAFDEIFIPNAMSNDATIIAGDELAPSAGAIQNAAVWESGVGTSLHYFGAVASSPTASNYDGSLIAGVTSHLGSPRAVLWHRSSNTSEYLDYSFTPARITADGLLVTGLNRQPPPPLVDSEPWIWHTDYGYGSWFFAYMVTKYGFPLYFDEPDPSTLYGGLDPYLLVSESGSVYSMIGGDWYVNVTPLNVVVMGDSYTSGEGVENYTLDSDTPTNKCHRSQQAYARLIGPPTSPQTFYAFDENSGSLGVPGYSLDFIACSGAKTKNLLSIGQYQNEPPQLLQDKVDSNTDLVVLTIGGNDALFSDVVRTCATKTNCQSKRSPATNSATGHKYLWSQYLPKHIDEQVRENLRVAFNQIKNLTQEGGREKATIIVLGYPRPVSGSECPDLSVIQFGQIALPALGEIDANEQVWLRGMTDFLNEVTAQVADETGIHWVPVTYEFLGHSACDPEPWITGLAITSAEAKATSLHPNAEGQSAYAERIRKYLEAIKSYDYGAFESGLPKNPPATM